MEKREKDKYVVVEWLSDERSLVGFHRGPEWMLQYRKPGSIALQSLPLQAALKANLPLSDHSKQGCVCVCVGGEGVQWVWVFGGGGGAFDDHHLQCHSSY